MKSETIPVTISVVVALDPDQFASLIAAIRPDPVEVPEPSESILRPVQRRCRITVAGSQCTLPAGHAGSHAPDAAEGDDPR